MSDSMTTTDSKNVATDSVNESLASQQAMLAESMRVNTCMAWMQLALGLAGKVSGR